MLGRDGLGPDDDFFHSGGDSIATMYCSPVTTTNGVASGAASRYASVSCRIRSPRSGRRSVSRHSGSSGRSPSPS
ncbi:hypothetical protein [Streptomyces eurythermus]